MNILHLFLSLLNLTFIRASIADYFVNAFSFFNGQNSDTKELIDYDQKYVPYELSLTDEKFIEEAIKLTGVDKSELDKCQHRVVLQLQTSCHKMNDEQMAKMAVMLLNCQSVVEGRQIYPCTDSMTLKDCTSEMDSIAWNTYHIMSNRARAVCYYIRNVQFRGLTEQTVNQLMHSAQMQINKLQEISVDQEQLHGITKDTLDTINRGYDDLHNQQEDIIRAQLHNQLAVEDNIKRLVDEKYLIKENKELLADLTTSLNMKLENALKQLDAQTEQNTLNHKELIGDILRIQSVANTIFAQIDESSKMLIEQNRQAQIQLNLTIESLKQMNSTVSSLVNVIGGTKQALEERLVWITEILGGTDISLERLYVVIWHFCFLIAAMILCAFLNATFYTRIMVFVLLPLNIALYFNDSEQYLNPIGLVLVILLFVFAQIITIYALNFKRKKAAMLKFESANEGSEVNDQSYNKSTNDTNYFNTTSRSFDDIMEVPTPPLSRNGILEEDDLHHMSPTPSLSSRNHLSSRSRSRTPLLNTSIRSNCHGTTRMGTRCKLSSLPGRDYCYRHQNGDSIIG